MSKKPVHNRKYLKGYRKSLRSQMTTAEVILWMNIQKGKLDGLKFRRQHSIENFIVDFYCPEKRLIIEVDGGMHNEPGQQLADDLREDRLLELGNHILRFDNDEIEERVELVLESIRQYIKSNNL